MSLKCNLTPEESAAAFRRFDLWICGEEEETARECFDPILFYESIGGGRRQYWCTATRHTWQEGRGRLGGKHKDIMMCPHCDKPHKLLNVNKYSYEMTTLQEWVHAIFIHADESGALLISAGLLKRRFNWSTLFGEIEWAPMRLYYIAPGKLQGWECGWNCGLQENAWRQSTTIREPFQPQMYTYDGSYAVIGADQVERSALRFCRLRDFFLSETDIDLYDEPHEMRHVVKYLAAYAMFPTIELAERLGFYVPIDDLMLSGKKNARFLNWEGRTPAEFLKMSKPDAKAFVRWGMEFEDLRTWKTHAKELTFREYVDRCDCLGGSNAFLMARQASEKAGVKFAAGMKYIAKQMQGDLTPRDKERVIRLWKDYIDMADQLDYDMTDPTVLMPKNLRERHDAAAALIEFLKREKEEKLYEKRYKKLSKKFGFSAGGLTVVVPKNSDEIVQEGKTLKHCVGGYAARHMDGKVVILFIRKARRPERSFLTVELSTDDKPRIRQVHGYRNDRYEDGSCSTPEEKYAWFFDTWLGWVRAGSRRDRKGNPIIKEEAKTA